MRPIAFPSLLASALLLVACGEAEAAPPSCTEVCARLSSLCGASPPGCEAGCEAAGPDARRCVLSAPTCEIALACGSDPGNDAGPIEPDGGTPAAIDCLPDRTETFGFYDPAIDTCSTSCRTYGGLGGTGTFCTATCASDDDCDPDGTGHFVCHPVNGWCTWPCGSDAACAGFRTCDVANEVCTM